MYHYIDHFYGIVSSFHTDTIVAKPFNGNFCVSDQFHMMSQFSLRIVLVHINLAKDLEVRISSFHIIVAYGYKQNKQPY